MAARAERRQGRARGTGDNARQQTARQSAPRWSFGRFVWHDFITPDVERSKTYYSRLFGWKYQELEMGQRRYPTIMCEGVPQGGLMAGAYLGGGAEPGQTMAYLSTADIDAAATAVRRHGGQVLSGPMELPGVGRLAVLADAQGAVFSVICSEVGDAPPPDRAQPGHFWWAELATEDPPAARRFYREVAGWQTCAPGGTAAVQDAARADGVELLAVSAGQSVVAAASLRLARPELEPGWLSAVAVDELASAGALAVRLGGTVVLGALAIPGLGNMAVIRDPLGTALGLFQTAR